MLDNENLFSRFQPLAEGPSANTVHAGPDDIGLGEPVCLQIILAGGARGELTVKIETADDERMTEARTVATYVVPEEKVLRAGVVLVAALPTGCGRFLRLVYSGAAGGHVTAALAPAAQTSGMR